MASIQRHKNMWRAQIYVGGVRESAIFPDKFEAETWAKKREIELGILKSVIASTKRSAMNKKVFLDSASLYTEDEIVAGSIPIPLTCGIYFLVRDGVVVYVGQSKNVHRRINDHKSGKEFDRINVIECLEKDLDQLEALYIKKFRPLLNIFGVDRYLENDAQFDAVCCS